MLRQFFLITSGLALVTMAAGQSTPEATFTKYCVTCHNARLKTAGFVLDIADLKNVGGHAEIWEKVVRKLRTEAMPPAGAPRPDRATYDSTASFLEAQLDRAAAARPNPGSLPLLHRLTRTEYQNAIRDLLAVDALPKEMDYSLLLPADNASSGFDNISDLLFVSPTSMERYLDAAAKISRLAIGDPATPEMVNIYRLSDESTQDVRLDELPFGTRGGVAVRSDFPVDGEYAIKVEFANSSRDQNQLLIADNGQRVVLETVGGQAGRGSEKTREFRIPLKAGPQLIRVFHPAGSNARRTDPAASHARPGNATGDVQRDDQRSFVCLDRAKPPADGAFLCVTPRPTIARGKFFPDLRSVLPAASHGCGSPISLAVLYGRAR